MPSKECIASRTAIILFLGMACFQLLVAVGQASVSVLWGGGHSELTMGLRLASVCAAVVLCGMAYVVHQRHDQGRCKVASWMIFGYMCLNTLGNALSENVYERSIMTPLTIILAFCVYQVASSCTPTTRDAEEEVGRQTTARNNEKRQ